MIKIKCPLTGASYNLPQFNNGTYVSEQLHPIFNFELSELNKIRLPASESEQVLLVHAYLWQINQVSEFPIIEWHSGIADLSSRWINASFTRLVKFVNYCALNNRSSAVQYMPQLRISAVTTGEQINAWLDSCEVTIKEYTFITNLDKQSRDLYESNLGREFTDTTDKKVNSFTRAKNLKTFLLRSFSHFPDDQIHRIYKILFRPNGYEVKTLKEVKLLCLDLLLENNDEDCREKDNIILKLDQAIYDKLSVIERLNESVESDREEIKQAYTVFISGEAYENTMLDHGTVKKPTISTPKLPESEPKREDYKSNLAFTVACRRWIQSQEQNANANTD